MLQDRSFGLSEGIAGAWQPVDERSVATERQPQSLADLITDARSELERRQCNDGHWCYEFEADATIPSEYILLEHFLGEIDPSIERKIAVYLRARQADHGGWPLFPGGDLDISASVKTYYALKLIGDDPAAPHMRRAREAILARGGAAHCNVFTRITLALFGQVPWRAVPVMPVEIMLLPSWFPFHLDKVSYWSRTVIAPLLILMALKPRPANPREIGIEELFAAPPEQERHYNANPTGATWGSIFLAADHVLRWAEPFMPKGPRRRAIQAAIDFITPRLNGEDGLGGIFPAMANTVMAFTALGYADDHPDLVVAKQAIRKLLVVKEEWAYCQPCLSPVWDTALACHALLEAKSNHRSVERGLDWLLDRQILEPIGDWAKSRPGLVSGGWPFEYRNDHYPDIDDTAVVVCALHRADPERYRDAIDRATEWIFGMQSKNGGWGSFDVDNTHHYLNNIPFADHGALLDPPTADLTARCVSMLAQLGYGSDHPPMTRALDYLKREQEPDGSWFGRWGTNYIYGTWSVLGALNAAGEDMRAPYVRKAVDWLVARQHTDGGWGESCASYSPEYKDEWVTSTPSQTAWALLGLMAADETESDAVARGIEYLRTAPRHGDQWDEDLYNAVGFPRVFYLHYHGYRAYFPLWALARYTNLMAANDRKVRHGM